MWTINKQFNRRRKNQSSLIRFFIVLGYHEIQIIKKVFRPLINFFVAIGQLSERILTGFWRVIVFTILLPINAFRFSVHVVEITFFRITKGVNKISSHTKKSAQAAARNTGKKLTYWQKLLDFKFKTTILQTKRIIKDNKDNLSAVKLKPQKSLLRPALSFALLLIILFSPVIGYRNYRFFVSLKDKIISHANVALAEAFDAKSSIENKQFELAGNKFNKAGQNLLSVEQNLSEVNGFIFKIASLMPNEKMKLAGESQNLVELGQLGVSMASDISLAVDNLFSQTKPNLTSRLRGFLPPAKEAADKAEKIEKIVLTLNEKSIPAEYREQFKVLKDKIHFISSSMDELTDLAEKLEIFLGGQTDKRYLMVFQNNTEMRGSGGFMGSFAVVDFSNGAIKSIKTPGGGTYDTDGGLRRIIAAPEPLRMLNPSWHLWDANWWPDWPTSAKKIMWFYEKSDGSSVDGVIAITPNVIIDLLKLTGPINMPNYNEVVSADNFMDVVQAIAEQKTGKTDTPKKIIGDLTNILIDKLTKESNKEQSIKLLDLIENNLTQKYIITYFKDNDLQNKVIEEDWGGAIKETNGDYLMIANANIGGQKSDKKMFQTIEHVASIDREGNIIDTIYIKRDHRAIKGEEFCGVLNVNWMRIYTPLGSKLIEAEGFKAPDPKLMEKVPDNAEIDPLIANEISAEVDPLSGVKTYRENNKTVFAGWTQVNAGQAFDTVISYRLPFKIENIKNDANGFDKLRSTLLNEKQNELARYTLLIQKQPGSQNIRVVSRLIPPDYSRILWQYPKKENGDYFALDSDQLWAYLLVK